MKVLFVTRFIDFIDPLGIMCLAASLKKSGFETALVHGTADEIIKGIKAERPDIVAYSAITGDHTFYQELNRSVKNELGNRVFSIMGGPHPTYFPDVIEEEPSLDAICMGEGEDALLTLASRLRDGKNFSDIPSIRTKGRNGHMGPLIEDLDRLPFADRDIIYSTYGWKKKFPVRTFMTSRGCPFQCTYCYNPILNAMQKGPVLRRHSVDYVIDEALSTGARYPLGFIKFEDDVFSLGADDWLREFSKKYKAKVGVPFNCCLRLDTVDIEMLRLLKEAGCRSITMAIDSANPDIRERILKRRMSNDKIVEVFKKCREIGIATYSNMIVGLPESTMKDEENALDLYIGAKTVYGGFTVLMPYPKTEITEYCKRKGYLNKNFNEYSPSLMGKSLLNCFGEKEKNFQQNLIRLGAMAVAFPCLRRIVLWLCHKVPTNLFFLIINYLTRVWLFRTKITPVRIPWSIRMTLFVNGIRNEIKNLSFKIGQPQQLKRAMS